MSRHRVAVTGLGAITPAGRNVATTWEALKAGRSAVRISPFLDLPDIRVKIAADVADFDPASVPSRQPLGRVARSTQYALAAALEAWHDAKLDAAAIDPERCGVVLGNGFGDTTETSRETEHYVRNGPRAIRPTYIVRAMPNAATAHVSLEFGLRGPSFTTSSACAAGSHAIAMGARLIQAGDADLVLAGGAEALGCAITSVAFDRLQALSSRNDEPARASRPFDRQRDGFVLGEGAAVLVLERWEHARARGVPIVAEIAGAGMTSEAHHILAPDPSGAGAARAMALALRDADVATSEVGYVNAHGTSTKLNDAAETRALHQVFGTHAPALAVSATKSMIGHLIGSAGPVGVLVTVLTLRDGIAHPTINQDERDPQCDLDYVPNAARPIRTSVGLANAFAFGGSCVAIAVRV